MKILLLILCLFIPNIYASDDAISCSYKSGEKTINFGYYISSSGEGVITNFVVDGEKYAYYHNKIASPDKLVCPIVGQVTYFGDNNKHYYIARDREQFNLLIAADEIVRNEFGDVIGQIDGIINLTKVNSINYTHYDTKEITASEGVADETRKQMNTNIDAYKGGTCTVKEKMAIYEYFSANDFNSLSTFYGDNVFKRNGKYVKLSDECAKIASDLYNSTVNLVHMLSDYVDDGGNVECLNYLSLKSSYYTAYGAFTTLWVDTPVDDNTCNVISQDVRNILNSFFDSFRLISVVLTIFMTYLDGMKCLTKKDDSETKKWISNTVKRLIILVIALLLPFLINLVLDLIDKYMASSYVTVNGECVKAITGG